VLDDSASCLAPVAAACRVRVTCLPSRETLGDKRNRLLTLANGTFVAFWDDDDFFSAARLSVQSAPLRAGEADIAVLEVKYVYDALSEVFYVAEAPEPVPAYGTAIVSKEFVRTHDVQFPSTHESTYAFIDEAKKRGARVVTIPNTGEFVYVLHRTQKSPEYVALEPYLHATSIPKWFSDHAAALRGIDWQHDDVFETVVRDKGSDFLRKREALMIL